ncbi:LamG domain-containing protein [Alphaproteobacteria bacterium]|nr:LamG domain-containing protein [Alphaproteobacteria bacterium]
MKRLSVIIIAALCLVFPLKTAHALCTKFLDGACTTQGQLEYDTGDDIYKYCDGENWVSIQGEGTDGTCTAGEEADINYDTGSSHYEYCNGTNWIPFSTVKTEGACATNKEIEFDTTLKTIKVCNGANYINASRYADPVAPTSGLVGHWKFDEVATTTTAVDSGSGGNNGTLTNMAGTEWGAAIDNNGVTFTSSNDYVETADLLNGAYTVSTWVKIDSYGGSGIGRIFNKGIMSLYPNDGFDGVTFQHPFTGSASSSAQWRTPTNSYDPHLGKWVHITVSYDPSNIANDPVIYFNAEPVSLSETRAPVGTSNPSADNVRIGNVTAANRELDGSIDDFRIYDRVLSAAEVKNIFLETSSNGQLTNHWKLNDGAGSSIADSAGALTGTGVNIGAGDWVTGLNGGTIDFDGSTERIDFGNHTAGDTLYTASAWFRTTNSNANAGVFHRGSSSWTVYNPLMRTSNTGENRPGNVNFLYHGQTFDDGAWHHIAFSRNGSSIKLYFDGVERASKDPITGPEASGGGTANKVTIGAVKTATYNNYFDGDIDDVRLYDRELSADEIAALFNNSGCPE